MSNSYLRMDITLPLKRWAVTDPDFDKCKTFSEKRIKELKQADSDENPMKLGKYRVVPELELYMFCRGMLRSVERHGGKLQSIGHSKKKNIKFSFIFDERNAVKYDECYYNLVYLLATRGILPLMDSIKRDKRNTD